MIEIAVTVIMTDTTVIMMIIVDVIADVVISGGNITNILTPTMLVELKGDYSIAGESPFLFI